jgi:hypothetical protein
VASVPDPLLLRKSGSVGNRTRTSESVARNIAYKTTVSSKLCLCGFGTVLFKRWVLTFLGEISSPSPDYKTS